MNLFELYIVFLRGSLTAFSGLASLPVIQDSLVIHSHVLTTAQLNEAVMITRSVPGPVGLYFVSVGYFVAGIPGAITGWLATITPAFLIIPMTHFVGRKMKNPRVRSILDAVITASAGLLVASAIPLAKDALTNPVDIVIALVSFAFLLRTNIDTIWILLAAGVISTTVHALGVLQSLT
ncbi:chromate transporter [Sphingobium sp. SJ10-10]|uniref:chromate transporter n=1 Tax=Sphingobium sp. SJ10-10 TaxID=3114999 RepID=UPI002E198E7B|nr:chromate transporter [Sphingobium sp. SJ10-10]